jgi:hypothetical protein
MRNLSGRIWNDLDVYVYVWMMIRLHYVFRRQMVYKFNVRDISLRFTIIRELDERENAKSI